MVALLTAALLVSSSFLVRVKASDGDLDATFGIGGKAISDLFGYSDLANGMAVQTDGKIIVAGRAAISSGLLESDFGLARFNSDGTPDATFGSGGEVGIDFFGFADACFAVAVQTDGKILAAGGAFGDADNNFALVRLNSDGSVDGTFGVGGKVSEDFGEGINDEALDVAVQTDGKIVVVAGEAINDGADFIMARYNSDGTPDAGFGIGGRVTTDIFGHDDGSGAIAFQSDGKIIVGGYGATDDTTNDFALVRYNVDGSLDGAFGIGGKVTTDFFGNTDVVHDLAIQSDGKIVAAGTTGGSFLGFDFALARYNSDGIPDDTFGAGGKLTTDFFGDTDSAAGVVVQCDGKILAAGSVLNGSDSDIGLARYDTNGNPDPTFGINGKVTTDFLADEQGRGLGLQSDGKIVVGGQIRPTGLDSTDFAVVRYDGAGCVAAPCPKPQGYWKNNPSTWPVDSLSLGSQTYTKSEMLAILKTSTQTDASLILARQLIAAKLNLENGSDPTPVSSTIAHADALFSGFAGKLPYKVKPSSAKGQLMTADSVVLNSYNNALLTPGCAL
jgi:uncharacterized delta-60 repeat protein